MKKSSSASYFIKMLFVFVLIIAGFLSLLKETVFAVRKAQTLAVQNVLEQRTTVQPLYSETLKSEITPVSVSQTSDYTVHVPVLMYHYIRTGIAVTDTIAFGLTISPEQLDQQLQYIQQNGYQTISLNDLSDSLENKTPLPPKSLILTFDDGYRDFYTAAFPLLKKYNLRAVSFYVVGYYNYPGYMNWEMVREIHNSGLVDVESHTLGHLMLTKLKPEDAQKEIFDSKKILEEQLHKKVNYFAYPYGDLNDFVVNLAREVGYKLAFSTRVGADQHASEKLILKRISINGFDSFDVFKAKLDN